MKEIKTIKGLILKTKNKRIQIELCEDAEKKFFAVNTKTLIDFKKRHILRTNNAYSVETFVAIAEASLWFIENPEIKNKILLKELAKINKFNIVTDLEL